MDLNPALRKLVFAVVVLVLAGLGAFLITQGPLGKHHNASHGRAVGLTQPLSTPSSAAGLGSPEPTTSGLGSAPPPGTGVNIYQWLPFTQSGLRAAADVVRRFAAAYASYSYTQSTAGYERQMNGLVTRQLASILARGFATPGVAQIRARQKQIATGTGQITAIRSFGPSDITFLVTITQKVTGTQGTKQTATSYAVTVTGAATSWQVNDVQLASAGNT